MSKITLNIGLNVGLTEPQNQLSATLAALVAAGFVVTDTRIASGEWQGVTERTLVAVVEDVGNWVSLGGLCNTLKQDAIATHDDYADTYILHFPDGGLRAGSVESFQHIWF